MRDSPGRIDYVLVAFSATLWGTVGIFLRWVDLPGQEHVVVFMRSLLSLIFFVLVILLTGRTGQFRPGRHPLLLLCAGLILTFHWVMLFKAINLMYVGDAVFITYLAPVFVALLAPVLLRERLEMVTVLALVLAMGGMALISLSGGGSGEGGFSAEGLLYALLAAVSFAVLLIMLKRLREDTPTLTITLYETAVITVSLLPFTAFRSYPIDAVGWISIFVLGVFLSGGAGLIFVYGVKGVKAQHVGIITYLEPVSAMVFGALLLGESPGWQDVMGGLLIVAAGISVFKKKAGEIGGGGRIPTAYPARPNGYDSRPRQSGSP